MAPQHPQQPPHQQSQIQAQLQAPYNPLPSSDGAALPVTVIQSLLVDPLLHPRGQAHLSAASGLVRVGGWLYVVADDELHLGVFADPQAQAIGGSSSSSGSGSGSGSGSASGSPIGSLLRLFEGDLPHGKAMRKKRKPDLETLAALPPMALCPHGALLALGSGSRPNRETGVVVALDAQGRANGRIASVDLQALYAPLRTQFADLNIEGAFLSSGELVLLQRGNRSDARSACIRYDWSPIAQWLGGQRSAPPGAKSVQTMDLGHVGGVPLSLTDGTPLDGGAWAFSAVAEDTGDSVRDGPCVASAVGVIGPDGQLRQMHALQGAPKVEGIAAQLDGAAILLTLVSDADDPALASQLLRVRLGQG